jgi:hypothetical protein
MTLKGRREAAFLFSARRSNCLPLVPVEVLSSPLAKHLGHPGVIEIDQARDDFSPELLHRVGPLSSLRRML